MFARQGWARWAVSFSISFLVIRVGGAETPTTVVEDPLPVESQWKGKLAQLGSHPSIEFPPEVEAALTITRRDGGHVEAELRESLPGMEITFLCKGQLTRRADRSLWLEVRSYGVKGLQNAGQFLIDVPYTARLAGDTVKGSWKFVDKERGIDLGGDFQLARAKDE